ncbi:hypothetical protein acsn021_05180 [Anaerocolumna cellulosilytica]|uniref:Spore protein YkvP/CgeB glycosyl transferase-like domain-containing protein n=1 Tax=Anaerocolumna cellulosilytica TaxID=433286 RepID=A0A6S6QV47_9FIRM|nr:glycosyltransferase [Anaerocolumna cellulosilytica]MBB5195715.1 intracellular sulfur oxidation DsrE/DsrF family protein [Anaerocolumna cellulosilytica]BCJ92949.1 hypothetical protein acsn021_05180 [Anaerocolumna cellulosilytica]
MKINILILKGQSMYNVLRHASDQIADGFTELGCNVTILDLTLEKDCEQISVSLLSTFHIVFSFQALLFSECIKNTNAPIISYNKNVTFFGHIVDHPIYHLHRLTTAHSDNMHIACIDYSHIEFINAYLPNVKHTTFLSHGGFTSHADTPFKKRDIDIFFPSSYVPPSVIYDEIKSLPDVYKNIANDLIETMLINPMLTLQEALKDYLTKIHFTYSNDEFVELMELYNVIDRYIRAYTRDQIITCLLDHEIKVTVCGNGWEDSEYTNSDFLSIATIPDKDITNVINLMSRSKIVLNHVPTLQEGFHERIFTSMLNGAICLTNDFPIINKDFKNMSNIILYNINLDNSCIDNIKSVLNDNCLGSQIALNGYKIAQKSHSWAHNAEKILDYYYNINFGTISI